MRTFLFSVLALVAGGCAPQARVMVLRPAEIDIAGIGRLAVDALDSESLQTQSGDNYRANIWAVPYRVQ